VGTWFSFTNSSTLHFNPSGSPITWWWISAHGHTQLEHIFWNEYGPDIPSSYHEAAKAGDIAALKILFGRADSNAFSDKRNDLPLNLATRNGHIDVVRLLLQKGVYVRRPHRPFFHMKACRDAPGNQYAIVKALADRRAGIKVVDSAYGSLLIYAVMDGHLEIVKLLLYHGADVDGGAHSFSLYRSVEYNHLDIFKLLLQRGADFTAEIVPYAICQSPRANELVNFVMNFDYNQTRGLVNNTRTMCFIESTFESLCRNGRVDTVETFLKSRMFGLLENGLSYVSVEDGLLGAAKQKHWNLVRSLFDLGVDVNVGQTGGTMLQMAEL
jgi:hypothetical protein